MNKRNKTLINLVFFVILMLVNFLSAKGYINATSQSDVSASFPTLITPAGYAFSIWGVLYSIIFIGFIFSLFSINNYYKRSLESISKLFLLSCVINIAWTFVFSYKYIGISAILIVLLLISLLMIIMKLQRVNKGKLGIFEIGFGLYAGWLSIASVVNISAFLVSIDFDFFGKEKLFYIIVLAFFLILVLGFSKINKNVTYYMAIAWAFFAIIKKIGFTSYTDPLFIVLAAGTFLLLGTSILNFFKRKTLF